MGNGPSGHKDLDTTEVLEDACPKCICYSPTQFFLSPFFINKIFDNISRFSKFRSFLVVQTVKNPHAMVDICVQTLGREDPLEEGMATHSRVLAWRNSRTEEPGGLQSVGSQRGRQD